MFSKGIGFKTGLSSGKIMAIIAVLWALLITAAVPANIDQINPDGISYIMLARHLAEGRVSASVSSHWSPLIIWCLAPLTAVGVEGLAASRLVLAVWAGVFLAGIYMLAARFVRSNVSRLTALTAAVFLAVQTSVKVISPDLMMAAVLMFYFYLVLDPDTMAEPGKSFRCGLLGGLAYLAKHYALPFILVHYPLTLIIRRALRSGQEEFAPKCSIRAGYAMLIVPWMLGVALTAGPWVGILSWRAGHFTIASSAAHVAGEVSSYDSEQRRFFYFRLAKPNVPHLNRWEIPERDHPPPSSTAEESLWRFRQWTAKIRSNVEFVDRYLRRLDLFGLGWAGLLLWPALAIVKPVLNKRDVKLAIWSLVTLIVYAGGLILFWTAERYLVGVFWPLALLWSLRLGEIIIEQSTLKSSRINIKRAAALITVLVGLSFAAGPVWGTIMALKHRPTHFFRKIAAAVGRTPKNLASSDWPLGLYVSYHARSVYLGSPAWGEVSVMERELDAVGAEALLVWEPEPRAALFKEKTRWRKQAELSQGEGRWFRKVTIYAPPSPALTQ